jgi:hypothetical protein
MNIDTIEIIIRVITDILAGIGVYHITESMRDWFK